MRRIHVPRLPSPQLLALEVSRAPALLEFGDGALFGVILGDAGEGFAAVMVVDEGGGEFEGFVVAAVGAGGVVGWWFGGWGVRGGDWGCECGVEEAGDVGGEGAAGALCFFQFG